MPSSTHERRTRSASPTTPHRSYGRHDERSHHHSHGHSRHKHHHHSPFGVDILKTAASALGEAVVTGREDGHHHQHQHNYEDYDSRSIVAPDSKTADQVYDTLLQAAYTLGEIVGDIERKLGISRDDDVKKGSERRSRAERHGNRSREGNRGVEDWAGEDASGYGHDDADGTGTAVPSSGEYRKSPEATERYHYPSRRGSPKPGFGYESPNHDNRHYDSSRSPRNQGHSRSRSTPSKPKSKERKKRRDSNEDMILRTLPGLISRAAFVVDLVELNKKHKERAGATAKYAALMMGLKIVRQLRREYKAMCERRERRGALRE
ncbi:hypothetical protein EV426DRAFT_703286 [Tirmania nivea]|nr:hypothetical protein EV426DRAFT_703286 [Tirmania nivea]